MAGVDKSEYSTIDKVDYIASMPGGCMLVQVLDR